jgi:hypothetical protein
MVFAVMLLWLAPLGAQQNTPPNSGSQLIAGSRPTDDFWETTAMTYSDGSFAKLNLCSTFRLPFASGHVKVEREHGLYTNIDLEVENMKPAYLFGGDFNTYVLWAVTPEGGTENLGEVVLDSRKSKMTFSTSLDTFGLFVTAEPHFMVNSPSRFVVLQTDKEMERSKSAQVARIVYKGTDGIYNCDTAMLVCVQPPMDNIPMSVRQAWTSVQLAERAGAREFAPAFLAQAQLSLDTTMTLAQRNIHYPGVDVLARDTIRLAVAAQTIAQDRAFQIALQSRRDARDADIAQLQQEISQTQDPKRREQLIAQLQRLQHRINTETYAEASRQASTTAAQTEIEAE